MHVKPGIDTSFLENIGHFIVVEKPEVIVNIGDFADMESLCHYDKGKMCFEGRSYKKDCDAAINGMRVLLHPINQYNAERFRMGQKKYEPLKVMLIGNHENRQEKAVQMDRSLEDTISIDKLRYREFGWVVAPFLQTVKIAGVNFCHYFTSGVMGRPVASAKALLQKKHQSCVMGHVQNRDIAYDYSADGKLITGLFCGTCYDYSADYLGPQGNNHFRGVWMLKDVHEGSFEAVPYTLEELKRRYA